MVERLFSSKAAIPLFIGVLYTMLIRALSTITSRSALL